MSKTALDAPSRVLRGGRVFSAFGLRIGALLYDLLLVVSIIFLGSAVFLPVSGGEAPAPGTWLSVAYQVYLLALVYLFFVLFWTRGGRTLGMLAWRLRVVNAEGVPPTLGQASARFVAAGLSWALLGLGFVWALFDAEHRALHDRLAGTWLIREPHEG
ncbi:MAG: RDD family protein [Halorhodospira halophila]|uniref:RDD family protein n=1 Tax=Halorhodospira TaxID=85108 RepID=UPI0019123811|nr:RDD family protein [Halorhodospira halophila]MCG5533591.1 RDD family protein [Halorhodospira sp. 9621]MCG5537423.1 RDD family protein [Halorhodospira sp. 9622]MCG5543782.1 RDD family protein [Halorhodospira sp. 9628]MCC3751160.1 RDD family protein [Halorhodospira halophila]MCG5528555.1 RDD family protein [Halorhodospira halophila]